MAGRCWEVFGSVMGGLGDDVEENVGQFSVIVLNMLFDHVSRIVGNIRIKNTCLKSLFVYFAVHGTFCGSSQSLSFVQRDWYCCPVAAIPDSCGVP